MINFKPKFFFYLFILICKHGDAQNCLNIRGIVVDSSGTGISNATVCVFSSKDTLFALTGLSGRFNFRRLKERRFGIHVTLTGFAGYKKEFLVDSLISSFQIEPITLKIAYVELPKAIVISAKPIYIKEDTIEYRADFFKVKEGTELGDLLKKLPGIWMDMNNNVSMQGKKISYLLVNGKVFFGGDISLALQNLPADIVDRVQVINEYGDQSKLTGIKIGEPVKILNIELKKEKRYGEFGNILIGTGAKKRYTTNVFVNSFKNDRQLSAVVKQKNIDDGEGGVANTNEQTFSLNYNDRWDPKWMNGGNISLSRKSQTLEGDVFSKVYLAEQNTTEKATFLNSNNGVNLLANYLLQYEPLPSILFKIEPSLAFRQELSDNLNAFHYSQQDSGNFQKQSVGVLNNRTNESNLSEGINIYYQKVSNKKKRRVSIRIKFDRSQDVSSGTIITTSDNIGNGISDSSRQCYTLDGNKYLVDLKTTLNYYEPVGKKSFFEFNYSFQWTSNRDERFVYIPDSGNRVRVAIDSLNNYSQTRSVFQLFHVGYIASTKQLNLVFAIDALPNTLSSQYFDKNSNTRYSFVEFTPVGQLSYFFSKTQRITFEYKESIQQPSPYQLQPTVVISNPQFPTVGNPNLKSEIEHNINTQYEHSYTLANNFFSFSIGIHFAETRDKIITNLTHPHDNSPVIQKTAFINANGFYSWKGNLHFDLPAFFKNSLKVIYGAELYSAHYLSVIDSTTYSINGLDYTQNIGMHYTFKDYMELSFSANYSLNTIHYLAGAGLPGHSSSLILQTGGKANFTPKWEAGYNFSQSFASGFNQPFKSNPALVNVYTQKTFLKNGRITVKVEGHDLLNSSIGRKQYISPGSIVQSHINLIGRYYVLYLLLKFSQFHK